MTAQAVEYATTRKDRDLWSRPALPRVPKQQARRLRPLATAEEATITYRHRAAETHRWLEGSASAHRRSVGFEYARWQLEQIALHHADQGLEPANPAAEARMLQLLRSLLRPGTLYPTMSVDEDGDVIAEWRIMDHGVELIASESRTYWVLRTRGQRAATSTSLPGLRTLLSDITRIADEHNPRWPALFPQANSHAR